MSDTTDWHQLVERVLQGTATSEEASALRAWLSADPARAQYTDRIAAAQRLLTEGLPDVDVARAIDRMRLRANIPAAAGEVRTRIPAREPAWILRAAAAVVVAVGLAGTLLLWHGRAGQRTASLAVRTYATAPGQRETVTLTDGTEFMLAPSSTLRVPLGYGARDRAVMLEGEAFFTVVHDAAHPFAVQTARATVEDIGTQFDVRAYWDDRDVRVAVAEGEVGIGNDKTLRAGDVAVIDTAVAISHDADVAAITGWTTGRLTFVDTPLPDIAATLERWYGVRITVEGPALRSRDVTLTLERLPLETALGIVARAAGAQVQPHAPGAAYTFK